MANFLSNGASDATFNATSATPWTPTGDTLNGALIYRIGTTRAFAGLTQIVGGGPLIWCMTMDGPGDPDARYTFNSALTTEMPTGAWTYYAGSSGTNPPTVTQQAAQTGSESAPSNTVSTTPRTSAPNAPTNLTAAFVFANVGGNPNAPAVSLAWAPPASGQAPTSYQVFRGTTAGGENATAIATGITGLTWQDTTVSSATTYFYQVKAVFAGSSSVASNEISVKTATLAPTALSVVPGDGQCVLSWTGASGALSYNVKRSSSSAGTFTTIANTTSTSYTDKGLANGTACFYFVTSLD